MHAVGAVTIKALCVIEGFSDYFEEYSHYFFFIINKVCLNSSGHFITCVVLLYGCFFHYLKIKKLKKPNKTHCCVGLSSTSARADFFFQNSQTKIEMCFTLQSVYLFGKSVLLQSLRATENLGSL